MRDVLRNRAQALSLARGLARRPRQGVSQRVWQTRCIQIRPAPSREPVSVNGDNLPIAGPPSSAETPDARFDVIGAPYSLLSVTLSASQNLYTRRGTLLGLSGKADNVISTLSILEPTRRAIFGVPFLYQKISSATPVNALVSVRSPLTSFTVLHLNGSVDWMIAQRRALLAWSGRSLTIRPKINSNLSIAYWGSSEVTGRGLLALVGNGQLYSIDLKAGEQYIAHPSNVVAYTITSNPPRPYRFKSTTLKFQVPGLRSFPRFLQESKFLRAMSDTDTWKTSMRIFHKLRTWARMTIWGDRLFLQFDGPTKILVQSRGPRLNDVLSTREVNEIADAPRGVTAEAVKPSDEKKQPSKPNHDEEYEKAAEEAVDVQAAPVPARSVGLFKQEVKGVNSGYAEVTKGGKVVIETQKS
ncbi:Altered inheritance of mitochondria protein 24, mitochondrial [Monascus purpureus]|uniref:Altered inheritance of mitochondria protein 24, mitochondrial n=1 Tax=Monascus purpureus TaxID=5098 RepID=A0A507R4G2_MONPU|nr:Altered inheritance of mitochondria protein 24, mitochondrial [Monascus purpureus]BDD55639.1 Altered inheritance of mitochondria protein 24, mitochondrial [Monascus purpureus]